MRKLHHLLAAFVVLSFPVKADNWPQWRGPNFNGSTSEKGLPAQWSQTEGVRWATDMPGPSAATPIVWEDRVFTTAAIKSTQKLVGLALDRKTGKILWERDAGLGYGKDDQSTYATASPLTDGRLVWFFFGSGDLAAFDLAGNQVWARNLQKDYGAFAFLWTFSSSPLLYNGKLYVQVLQRDVPVNGRGRTDGQNDSYLLALDPQTGKELWRVVRPTEAVGESREAFSTPIPCLFQGRAEILILGGDLLSGHHPDTGKELWRWGTWNPTHIQSWRLVPSPVIGGGVALACAPKDGPICAVKLGGNGVMPDASIAWKVDDRELTTDVATPLLYEGKFYVANTKKRLLFCVEPATGKVLWRGALEGKTVFDASPTGADGKIYLMNHNGDVSVVKADPAEFKLLASIPMDDSPMDRSKKNRASVAAAQGSLFIRTLAKLYCVGK
ncbi:MAG: PQQ-binding-like beta-propeller repeat protein [Verrucomicrobiota bacterium]